MKLTTGRRGPGPEDARRKMQDRESPRRRPSVLCLLSSVLWFTVLAAAGCQDRSSEQAQQEVAEARAAVEQLKHNLNKAREEISTLRAELGAVRQNRDELQESIVQLTEDRDQAAKLAQQAQVMVAHLTSRANGQVSATTALEKQIAELKALVEEQQKLIEHLQKGATTEPTPVETAEEPALPTEPNENR